MAQTAAKTLQSIPPYVYKKSDEIDPANLSQGDILRLQGPILAKFKEFFKEVIPDELEELFVMVITQTCDLIKRETVCNCSHINVCRIKPFSKFVEKEIATDKGKMGDIEGRYIVSQRAWTPLLSKLTKLINNSESKTNFFLPGDGGVIREPMVASLHLNYPFRTEHYQALLEARCASLQDAFVGKIGYILSDYFGRIASPDLTEKPHSWKTQEVVSVATEALLSLATPIDDSGEAVFRKGTFQTMEALHQAIGQKKAEKVDKANQTVVDEMVNILKFLEPTYKAKSAQDIADLKEKIRKKCSKQLEAIVGAAKKIGDGDS